MSTIRTVVSSLLVAATTLFVTAAVAQEVRLTVRDYVTQPCRPYSPDDPCQRSKWFRLQTGHFGYAYNCDSEECKRNSPYICWTAPTNHPLPPIHRWVKEARCDLREALGRIADGSCAHCESECSRCGGSGCAVCQQTPSQSAPNETVEPSLRVAQQAPPQAIDRAAPISLVERFTSRESKSRVATADEVTAESNPVRTASAATIEEWQGRYRNLRASQSAPISRAVESDHEAQATRTNPIAPSRQRLFR